MLGIKFKTNRYFCVRVSFLKFPVSASRWCEGKWQEVVMFSKAMKLIPLTLCACLLAAGVPRPVQSSEPVLRGDGVVTARSAYPMDETIDRIKKDIASKGIMFFTAIDQAKLAADAGIKLHPSTLLIFGNPPLGVQFISAKPAAGLDWPVRLLVFQDENGAVWTAYTDFNWIAKRHQIENLDAAFKTAAEVIGSIT